MSYTYNITFLASPQQEEELLQYLRLNIIPNVFNNESPAINPNLKKVMEAGGEKIGPEQGISIALSGEFQTEEQAHLWNDHILLPSLMDFQDKFGQNALFFITLLKNLSV